MASHILLIDCDDEKGLVYRVTGVLLAHDLNIISNAEFVDPETSRFFMRTEFTGRCDESRLVEEVESALPAHSNLELTRQRPKKIVCLATKEPHCLGELLLRYSYRELNAEILAVIANHPDLEGLVDRFDVPFHFVSHAGRGRREHELEVMEILDDYMPEYLVLPKYMRILTPEFVGGFPNRIVNIHHSFLPAFAGANPYRQAYERGVKIIGATAHFVTEGLDEGPIIAQGVIPVDHTQNIEQMTQAGRDVEKVILAKALQLVFDERVFVIGNRTVIL